MAEFFSQGGYAFYIWSAYGVCAVLLVAELLSLRARRKELLAQARRLMRMRSSESQP